MKKELIVNISFGILYIIITSLVLAYSYGIRPNRIENDATSISLVKTGAINVEADGDNNQIFLNGEIIGTAPKRIDGLLPKTYTITIKKEGYDNFESIVTVIADTYINIKPEMIKSEFGGNLLLTKNITDNFTYKFQPSNNTFTILDLNGNILSVSRLTIQNPLLGLFNESKFSDFEINNFEEINLPLSAWGVDASNSTIYIYNKQKNLIYLIDLISKNLTSTLDLRNIIIPDNISVVGQDLYISNKEKVYKYNFQSKALNIKYTQSDEIFSYSSSNPSILFNSSKIRILSSNSTINDFSEFNFKFDKNESNQLVDVHQIPETKNYLLVGKNYIEIIDEKANQIYYKEIEISKISTDKLHILTKGSILKYSYEKGIYVEEIFSPNLTVLNTNIPFNYQNISSFLAFNKRNAFLFVVDNKEYISDYNLSAVNVIHNSEMATKVETVLDSYDNLFLLTIKDLNEQNNSGKTKTITIYKY